MREEEEKQRENGVGGFDIDIKYIYICFYNCLCPKYLDSQYY